MPLEGPWYTLDEAVQKLNTTRTDLLYEIEQGKWYPAIISPKKPFLLYSTNESGQKIGHCHFYYQGALTSHPELFTALAKEVSYSGIFGYQLLDTRGISSVSLKSPFKGNGPLDGWMPHSIEEGLPPSSRIVLMPYEGKSFKKSLEVLTKAFTSESAAPDEHLSAYNNVPLEYNWRLHDDWQLNHIRVPASEIRRVSTKGTPPDSPNSCTKSKASPAHQLRELIASILTDHPSFSSHELWKIIRRDCEADDPIYDKDKILERVDGNCIEWVSSYGNEQSMKRSTFNNTVSQLRKGL
jgi:hypothetical protein